jgi:hypothetical protein
MPPYEGCLLDPTLPECVPLTPPLTSPPIKSCHPSYPDTCIPGPPPNLNCGDVSARNFKVVGSDPHGFDGDNDGIGCENGNGGGGGVGGNGRGCDPSYPDDCIPPLTPDLNCGDSGVPNNVKVVPPDPHRLDGDNDGVGCEGSGRSDGGDNGINNGGGSTSTSECQGQADCFRGTANPLIVVYEEPTLFQSYPGLSPSSVPTGSGSKQYSVIISFRFFKISLSIELYPRNW